MSKCPIFSILFLALITRAFAIEDPAPPTLHQLVEMVTPEPSVQPELIFYQAPKPLPPEAKTSDWKNFLGPTHNAYSPETKLLKGFGDKGPAKVWEVSRGEGYASAMVSGERVVIFHRMGGNEVVECLQAETGKRFWKHEYPTKYKDRYGFGGGPRCQPVSDGEFVYTLGAEAKLNCLELATGQVLWSRSLKTEFDLTLDFFGVGGAPLLEGDLLIINIGAPNGPSVAAFNKRTGKMVWGAGDKWGPSYASPIPADTRAGRRIFVFAGGESRPATGGLMMINPVDGNLDYSFPWRGGRYESVNASSPVVVDNKVYISECYGAGGVCLDIQKDGSCQELWRNEILNTHFMTAVHKEGYLYGIDGHGPQNAPIVCIEMATGKRMWKHEPEWMATVDSGNGPQTYNLSPALASFIEVDGRCLVLGQYGHLAWLDLNPEGYKELDLTHLFMARQTWAMPALSKGLLYVGQNDEGLDGSTTRFICYDLRE
jgi:outer membrane protein assembly factor BamB